MNVFLDDDRAQAHLLLRDGRLVVAFPSHNSGMGVWFEGKLEVVADSLLSLETAGPNQAVEFRLRVLEPTVVRKVVLDSIRVLRDESEGAPTSQEVEKARLVFGEAGAVTLQQSHSTLKKVTFQRSQRHTPAEAGPFALEFFPAQAGSHGELHLLPGDVKVIARLPFPSMMRFSESELYSPEYLTESRGVAGRAEDSLKALEFLARREKMMAGSWRFLTYFGRDTLISLAMLEPILSDQALLSGVRSVLDRLSPEGVVAHEEDIGPWAEWRHLQAGQSGMEPVYDYKMVDDDLLLPVLLAKLHENGRSKVVKTLLQEPKSREAILRNADYVLSLLSQERFIRLNSGEMTGDWRDSHEGLGGGVFPASVNSDLALPALDSLTLIYSSLSSPPKEKLAQLDKLRPKWKRLSESYWIELSPSQVQACLQRYSQTLTPEQQEGFEKLKAVRRDLLEKPFRFPVLSFNDDGSPVVVPHTDVAFTLFYGHPDLERLADILTLLERPFPYGLATPAGHLIASPVYSNNPSHYQSLGFGQYHGLVVWSWPSAMLQFGLLRQLGRDPSFDSRIESLLSEIRANEQRVGPLATSELWAVALEPEGIRWRAYGIQGDQAESNALQLWSTVFPALEFVRQKAALGR